MTPLSSGIDSGTRDKDFPEGVSVIVCAHNAAGRIGQTLRHLARQRAGTIPWEIIVVDNASIDGTAEVARREWPGDAPVPLRILNEPTPGYNHAAECGIAHARFSVVAHVHDDNWLEDDWIARVATIFSNDPEIGACGGQIKASLDSVAPGWFQQFAEYYAVGPQAQSSGDITWTRGYLWGAGLCIRQTAWAELKRRGFRPLTSGRTVGHKLISGEDSEICFALRLAGWRLWYSEELSLTHFIPAARLEWPYVRRLVRSFGEASALHDCYVYPVSFAKLQLEHIWRNAFLESLDQMRTMYRSLPAFFARAEGDAGVLRLEREFGRAVELFRLRHIYAELHRDIFHAPWRDGQAVSTPLQSA